jgi:hypothetical protein
MSCTVLYIKPSELHIYWSENSSPKSEAKLAEIERIEL